MASTGKGREGDRPESREDQALTPDAAVETVGSLIEMMAAGGVKELDVSFGDVSIRLRSQGKRSSGSVKAPAGENANHAVAPSDQVSAITINAPMIGTFYVTPSPQDPPFVNVGDHVEAGQVIGIIEAMKIMNEIVADRSGLVVEIIARNGEAVEYGSPLFRLAADGTPAA
ncbi:MAG TPA: biotin/lipoyl-containing protein [Thermomicrobiales bacterium]|nr:biotin/lipoyl-containing protein [Thermomicrobiales bacterium]